MGSAVRRLGVQISWELIIDNKVIVIFIKKSSSASKNVSTLNNLLFWKLLLNRSSFRLFRLQVSQIS